MASNYDIEMFRGDDLSLFLVYQIDGNNFDFTGYSADMDIRRSTHSDNKVAELSTAGGVTGAGISGEYSSGGVQASTGGIVLNVDPSFVDYTGGVLIKVPNETTKHFPAGLNFYTLRIQSPIGTKETLFSGRIKVNRSVTD